MQWAAGRAEIDGLLIEQNLSGKEGVAAFTPALHDDGCWWLPFFPTLLSFLVPKLSTFAQPLEKRSANPHQAPGASSLGLSFPPRDPFVPGITTRQISGHFSIPIALLTFDGLARTSGKKNNQRLLWCCKLLGEAS